MSTKAQHSPRYRVVTALLRELRENANLSQRDIGRILNKPQSYVHNCEVANRRVDIAEFIAWSKACGVNPKTAFAKLLEILG